ncbi:transcription antitermination factor NusB [Weissella diestrammenae]|uniref:Transcription antitermination protein NusB n=1 Tax=Weissella diestrammenae TaxID=1162633 RepID=A0A7G9T6D1_9LACO|nr:transcription antitermination factor NusB [Weissella diestrammenae]MCM0583297.1 transcription antitermination factor NusB [Weissella diestrammenae]QNN75656.1 transcription antitermination factor NusB [Weissella diestrammenae]
MTKLTRHAIRQTAFQTLFGLSANPEANVSDVVLQVLAGDPEIEWTDEAPVEVVNLVENVRAHATEADLLISEHLAAGWTLDRLNRVDLELMRLAIYEATFGDVPTKVAVDEALNLARDFTDDTSSKFINGVLSKVLTF